MEEELSYLEAVELHVERRGLPEAIVLGLRPLKVLEGGVLVKEDAQLLVCARHEAHERLHVRWLLLADGACHLLYYFAVLGHILLHLE